METENKFLKNPKSVNGFASCDKCKGGEGKELNNSCFDTWQNGSMTLCQYHYLEFIENLAFESVKRETKKANEPKHFPRPSYYKCNKGHTLVEVYNEKYNRFDWDCPICIKRGE